MAERSIQVRGRGNVAVALDPLQIFYPGGYTLVLDMSEQQTPVLYAAPSLDITKALIEAYNVKSGVPAPPPPLPSAPKPATVPAP